MDVRYFTKEFLSEFIELYRSYPCVWKVKSKEYCDKNKREHAFRMLVQKLKEVEPNATRETVQKKINSIRNSWRKELKKVKLSQTAAACEDEIYKPHLWYFELLTFLHDQDIPRESLSNIDDTQSEENDDGEAPKQEESVQEEESSINSPVCRTPSPVLSLPESRKRKKHPQPTVPDETFDINKRPFCQCNSGYQQGQYKHLQKHWGQKLSSLAPEQRIYAEKLISDVFYEAALHRLGPGCHVVPRTPFPIQSSFQQTNQHLQQVAPSWYSQPQSIQES